MITYLATFRWSLDTLKGSVLLGEEFHAEALANGLAFVGIHRHWRIAAKAVCTDKQQSCQSHCKSHDASCEAEILRSTPLT